MNLKYLLFFLMASCASYKSNNTFEIKKEVHYGEDIRNTGDLYISSLKNAPIIITVHGGGWSSRSNSDMNSIAESLASHGFNVFNINYRFAPEHLHPAPIEDLAIAIKYLKKNYSELIDLNRIGLWGYSSGAHTVMSYGLNKANDIKVIIGGGGPFDLTWYPDSPIITPYMGYARNQNIEGWMKASPVYNLTKDAPSIFLYNGKTDKLVEHSQMTFFEAKAKLLGIDIQTHSVSFWGHQTAFIFSSESVELAIKFLKEKFRE